MAIITGFMYCDTVKPIFAEGKTGQQINLPLPQIILKMVPTEKSFSIAFCMDDIDLTSEHKLRIVFKNERDETIIDIGTCQLPENVAPNGLFFSIDIRNVLFNSVGKYYTQIFFDDISVGIYPINVSLQTTA